MLKFPKPSEKLRKKLLAEEQKLRAKQPEHWAKTKYRKFAALMKPRTEELLLQGIQELAKERKEKGMTAKGHKKKRKAKPRGSKRASARQGRAKRAKVGKKSKRRKR